MLARIAATVFLWSSFALVGSAGRYVIHLMSSNQKNDLENLIQKLGNSCEEIYSPPNANGVVLQLGSKMIPVSTFPLP